MRPYFTNYTLLNQSVIKISQNNSSLISQYNALSTSDSLLYSNYDPTTKINALSNTVVSFSNYIAAQVIPLASQTSNVSTFASTASSRLISSYNSVNGIYFSTLGYLVSSYTSVSTTVELNIFSPTFSTFTTDLITTTNININSALYASSIGINTSTTSDFPFSMLGGASILPAAQPAINHIIVGTSNANGKTTFINTTTPSLYEESPVDPGFTVQASDIAYNGSIWVVVGSNANGKGSIRYTSNPKVGWMTAAVPNGTYAVNCVKWNGTYWLAGTNSRTLNLLQSYNGINWSDAAAGVVMDSINNLAWNGFNWVSVGYNSVGPFKNIMYTDPTGVWNTSSNLFSGQGNSVAVNGRTWVAAGAGTSSILYSYNSSNWLSPPLPILSTANAVAWNGDKFLAGGSNGNSSNLMYSYKGVNWT